LKQKATFRSERPARAELAVELAELLCKRSQRRVGARFSALWSNALAHRVLESRYGLLEEGFADPADAGPAVSPSD
jgi:hypothetical protein